MYKEYTCREFGTLTQCCDFAVGFYVLSQDPLFGQREAYEELIGVQRH